MEITRSTAGDVLLMKVDGRVDGYWADHLDAALREAIAKGIIGSRSTARRSAS